MKRIINLNLLIKMLKLFGVSIIMLIVTGCTYKPTLGVNGDKINGIYQPNEIKGIKEFLKKDNIVLYYIHGMGTHDSNESEANEFFNKVAVELGYSLTKSKSKRIDNPLKNTDVTIIEYLGKEYNLSIVSISWAMVLNREQEVLNYTSMPLPDRVAYANKYFKGFINRGFGDAIMYSNPSYRKDIHNSLINGLDATYQEFDYLRGQPAVVISTSLGSKVFFDILLEYRDTKQVQLFEDLVSNLKQIVMTSNQLPLLKLFNKRVYEKKGKVVQDNENSFFSVFKRVTENLKNKNKKLASENIPIVAYSDPNDALSYYINLIDIPNGIDFTNVLMSHTNWWPLGIIANPIKAHGGFKSGDMGYKAIVYGSDYLNDKINVELD